MTFQIPSNPASEIPIIAIVGKSNSGKTTLIEKLLNIFTRQGLKIATIKHDAHSIDIDTPGKDTWRHREAGATSVVISSDTLLFLTQKLEYPISLEQIAETYFRSGYDLIIAEGFKQANVPKIEVHRTKRSTTLLFDQHYSTFEQPPTALTRTLGNNRASNNADPNPSSTVPLSHTRPPKAPIIGIEAIVSDINWPNINLPCFHLNDAQSIAAFISNKFQLKPSC